MIGFNIVLTTGLHWGSLLLVFSSETTIVSEWNYLQLWTVPLLVSLLRLALFPCNYFHSAVYIKDICFLLLKNSIKLLKPL